MNQQRRDQLSSVVKGLEELADLLEGIKDDEVAANENKTEPDTAAEEALQNAFDSLGSAIDSITDAVQT